MDAVKFSSHVVSAALFATAAVFAMKCSSKAIVPALEEVLNYIKK